MDLSAEEIHPFIDLDSSIIPGTGLLANAMHKLHIRYDSSQIKRIQMETAQLVCLFIDGLAIPQFLQAFLKQMGEVLVFIDQK